MTSPISPNLQTRTAGTDRAIERSTHAQLAGIAVLVALAIGLYAFVIWHAPAAAQAASARNPEHREVPQGGVTGVVVGEDGSAEVVRSR